VPFKGHTGGGGLSSYGSSQGPFSQYCPRWARKLRVRLEKYAHLWAGTFFSALMYYQFGYLKTIVSQVMSLCFFNDNDGMLLHIMGVRSTSSFSYLYIVLSWVITLYLFCHNDGCSILGFCPVEVMHSFKFIRT